MSIKSGISLFICIFTLLHANAFRVSHPVLMKRVGVYTPQIAGHKRLAISATNFTLGEKLKSGASALLGQSSTDRLLAAAGYMIPLADALEGFGMLLVESNSVPEPMQKAIKSGALLSHALDSIPLLKFTLMSLLYTAVIKGNTFNLSYFVKFNLLQAMILNTFEQVTTAFFSQLFPLLLKEPGFIGSVGLYTVAMTSFGAIAYCAVHAIMGHFPHLPIISDAVRLHIGDEQKTKVG